MHLTKRQRAHFEMICNFIEEANGETNAIELLDLTGAVKADLVGHLRRCRRMLEYAISDIDDVLELLNEE